MYDKSPVQSYRTMYNYIMEVCELVFILGITYSSKPGCYPDVITLQTLERSVYTIVVIYTQMSDTLSFLYKQSDI